MTPVRHPVVVVTGASSGVGRAVAHAFAERGADLVLAARDGAALREVAAECELRGPGGGAGDAATRALAVPTDVSDEAQVQALAAAAVERFGRVDVWVGAAASWSQGPFEDTPAHVFDQVVRTTLLGQTYGARAVLPVFRRQGSGVLVVVSSLYGELSAPYVAPYVAAKWGLTGFAEVLRLELRGVPGIHVSTVLPGTVDTPIYRHAAVYLGREIRPLPPVTSPERVARAVLSAADRPRRRVVVGQTQRAAVWVHHLLPAVYDRVVGPAVHRFGLRRETTPPRDGNVLEPTRAGAGPVSDGWRRHDHRRVAAVGLPAVALAAGTAAAVGRVRAALRLRT